jgi:hypothetical protein
MADSELDRLRRRFTAYRKGVVMRLLGIHIGDCGYQPRTYEGDECERSWEFVDDYVKQFIPVRDKEPDDGEASAS